MTGRIDRNGGGAGLQATLRFKHLLALSAALAGSVLLVLGLLGAPGTNSTTSMAGGIAIITLGFWITGVVPEFFTSLLFLFMAAILTVAPPDRVFSGFHSNALWLIFGGLVIGHSVIASGLGDRVVNRLFALSPPGYLGALITVALAGLGLSFVIPTAIGRAVLMAPLAVQLSQHMGFAEGSRGRSGVVLTAGMSTALPAFAILPSNVPNLVMSGTAENLFGISFSYSDYLAVNFPVLGGLGLMAIIGLNWWLFREEPDDLNQTAEQTKLSVAELKLAGVLAATVLLWVTDSWHGISPAWIALGAALLCASPAVGAIAARDVPDKINFAPLFFVAGVIGFGAVVSDTGLSALVGAHLVANLHATGLTGDAAVFVALTAIGMLVAAGTTVPTAPAVMTPLAEQIAAATEWPIEAVLLAQVPSWVIIPLPYLVPPILLVMSVGRIPSDHATRLMLGYFAVGVIVLAPAHFLWLRWMGVFG